MNQQQQVKSRFVVEDMKDNAGNVVSPDDMQSMLDEIHKDDKYTSLKLFSNNPVLYNIFNTIESLPRDTIMSWLFTFHDDEKLRQRKPGKMCEIITKILTKRFLKVGNYSLTSEAIRKSINFYFGENNEHITEFESKLLSILNEITNNDLTKVNSHSFVKFFAQYCDDKKESEYDNNTINYNNSNGMKLLNKMKNDNLEFFCFLKIIFCMIGLWWSVTQAVIRTADPFGLRIDEFHYALETRISQQLIDTCFVNNNGQTIYHTLAAYDFAKAFEIVMRCEDSVNAISQYKDKNGKSPIDWAIEYGRWNIFFATMGNKARQQLSSTKSHLEKQRGIIDHFLNDCNDPAVWEKVLESMIKMILNLEPISDDLLLLCWKYENSTINKNNKNNGNNNKEGPLNTRLWTAISTTMKKVLTIPINKRYWIWYEEYLFNSSMWYENILSIEFKSLVDKEILKRQKEKEMSKIDSNTKSNDKNNRHLKCLCKCGVILEPVVPAAVYGTGAECDNCRRQIGATDIMYHCPAGSVAAHPKGFDFCMNCTKKAAQEYEAMEAENAKMNENESDTLSSPRSPKGGDNSENEVKISEKDIEASSLILYDKLVGINGASLLTVKKFLKDKMDGLMSNESTKNSFFSIVNMEEYLDDRVDSRIGLRQDDSKIMKYPNKSFANEKQLREINALGTYDSQVYLSNLIIVGKILNKEFNNEMKKIYQIDRKTNANYNSGILEYKLGPVKDINRGALKAEGDYQNRPFPKSAQLLDIVRCSLSFDSCDALLNGIKVLENAMAEPMGSSSSNQESNNNTCLRKILRIKNQFAGNKRKFDMKNKGNNGNNNNNYSWLYQYGDIKCNVLVESVTSEKSMIIEIQFLLDFMIRAKQTGHYLYEIMRKAPFVKDLRSLLSNNLMDELFICSNTNNVSRLSQILMCYNNKINLFKFDKKGLTLMHHACMNGFTRIIDLLCSQYENDGNQLAVLLNTRCRSTNRMTPLQYCIEYERGDAIKTLLKYEEINIIPGNQSQMRFVDNVLKWIVNENRFELFKIYTKHPKFDNEIGKTAILFITKCNNKQMLHHMINHFIDLFDSDTLNQAFRQACLNGDLNEIRYLSKIKGVTPTPNKGSLQDSALFSSVHSQSIDTLRVIDEIFGDKIDWNAKDDYGNDIIHEVISYFPKGSEYRKAFTDYIINETHRLTETEFNQRVQNYVSRFDTTVNLKNNSQQ